MDILKPQLQYIDGICYRINPGSYCSDFEQGTPQPYYEFDSECSGMVEPENEENFEVEKESNGRYVTRFHVPKLFFPYLIGTKGATRRRLEGETRTTISIPKLGCTGDIVITGSERKNVCSARNRVNMVVISARKKQKPTHFLAISLVNDIFTQRFKQFKQEVLENCPAVDSELFQAPESLHLTVGVLKLCDNIEREQAISALEHCHRTVIPGILGGRRELRIRLQGLDYFNDDPSAIKVLYAKVLSLGESTILQDLANAVVGYFVQQGLMELRNSAENNVLLHATLMNMKFTISSPDYDKKNTATVKTFDASKIIELYKDYNFGEACISKLDLLALHTRSKNSDYWQTTASIDLFKF